MVATETAARRPSLTVVSGLLGLSALATRLTTLVVMAFLTRGAGVEAVGLYGLATLTASFTAAALSLGLPTYLTREAAAGTVAPPVVARIHCGRFAALLSAALVAYGVIGVLLPGEAQLAIFLIFVASLLEQWNETAWVLIRGRPKAWAEPLTNSSAGLLLVGACAVDTWLLDGLSLDDAAVYFLTAAVLRSVAALLVVRILPSLRASRGVRSAHHARRALPYFASDLLGLFYFRGDVFVLAFFVTAAELGEYVSATAIIGPAVQVAASMGIGALAYAAPRRAAGAGADQSNDPLTVFRFFGVAGQGAAGVMLLGIPIATALLFGDQAGGIPTLAMVLTLFLAMRFANFGLSALLLARGRATSRLVVLVLSICGSVGLNLALDGRYGAFGAAWAMVLNELVVAGSLMWFLRLRELLRPVAVSFGIVAAAAVALVGLLAVLDSASASFILGGAMLVLAAVRFLAQRRAVGQLDAARTEDT
ncbi:lipopolysaccharide biosynthesis protein [Plantactinospora sp. GCM10030261]|uniref:lipopolysaccharide biosynthesis protein n=1 Tax=Plantactinospora sp. GCM10030261 TaxID=3273420 RepID=UPI00361AAD01